MRTVERMEGAGGMVVGWFQREACDSSLGTKGFGIILFRLQIRQDAGET